MKIQLLIPPGYRVLAAGEKIIRGDLWIALDDAQIGRDWYEAYDKDPDANMVGHTVNPEEDIPSIFIRLSASALVAAMPLSMRLKRTRKGKS